MLCRFNFDPAHRKTLRPGLIAQHELRYTAGEHQQFEQLQNFFLAGAVPLGHLDVGLDMLLAGSERGENGSEDQFFRLRSSRRWSVYAVASKPLSDCMNGRSSATSTLW